MKLSIIIAVFITSLSSFAQAPLLKKWDQTFGGYDGETFTSFMLTSDEGFLLGGWTWSDSGVDISEHTRGGSDFWIVKTDSSGNKLWDKRFGGLLHDRLYGFDQTNNQGYIFGGFTTSDSSGDVSQTYQGGMDYWMVRANPLGNKLWDKRFGGNDYDRFTCIQHCSDNGFILGGFTLSDSGKDVSQPTRGGEDFWIVKTDSSGNKVWDKRFGGDDTDDLWCLQQTPDGGFILGGITNSDSTGDVSQHTKGLNDYWIVKIDSLGIKLWDRRYGGSGSEFLSSVIPTPDHGYILSGTTSSDSSGDVSQITRDTSSIGIFKGDIWSIKIDSVGNILWDSRFGGIGIDGAAGNASQTSDKGFVFGGNSTSPISGEKSENNFGSSQSWLVKSDSLGNKLWDKTIFTVGDDNSGMAIQTVGGCFVIANMSQANAGGYKTKSSKGVEDFWMVKFCETEQPVLPIADFTSNDSALCVGACFTFSNTSFNSSTFQWYFPGGNPSSSTSPFPGSICYDAPGNFDVTLIATSGNYADTMVQPGIVQVLPLPNATITQSADTLYAPQGNDFYMWSLNGVSLNDTNNYHVITQNGNYSILVIDYNGCPNWDTLFSVVLNTPVLAYSNQVNIYPNPTNGELKIDGLTEGELNKFSISDLTGREVLSKYIIGSQVSLHLNDLIPGIYIINISSKGKNLFGKFIKQ